MIKNCKGLALLLVAAMLLSLLSACSGSSGKEGASGTDQAASGKRVTITAWHGASGESAKFLENIVKKYNESQSNATVKLVFVDTDNMVTKLTAAAAGKALPEVGMLMWPMWLGPLKDVVKPLDEFIQAEPDKWNEDDFLNGLIDGNVRFDGVTYGIPIETNNRALYYNKKLFDEAGVTPPKTWDELVEAAQKLTDPAKKRWGMSLPTTQGGALDAAWAPFMWQAGGDYVNAEGTELQFNGEGGIAATQFFADLINKYKVASLSPPQNGFQSGMIAMSISGPWSIPTLNANEKLDYGIAPLPEGTKGMATILGGTNNFIFKTTPEKEKAAWDFLTWLSTPEKTAEFAVGYGSIPIRKSSSDAAVWKDFVKENPDIQVHIDGYQYGRYQPFNVLTLTEITEVITSHIEAAMHNKETAEEAMKKAYEESKPLLKTWSSSK
ncbi:ABC transporter substrate-binding protein [Paenibacillus lautus]|uniref:ABC transporter substrate-binding protein n=1 Tax=Paenibacillus lautus TaxID=1401 RepID=UPI000FD84E8E|nr:ABC transporter substrate-binding protein [Paenibacillus lautus]